MIKPAFSFLFLAFLLLSACSQESRLQRFERETQDYTHRNCPRRVDRDGTITLDSLVFHDDGSLDYMYCYSINASDQDLATISRNIGTLRSNFLSSIQNDPELRHVREEGLNIIYLYFNPATHEELGRLRFTPDDYGQ